jgi:hypothetical protein
MIIDGNCSLSGVFISFCRNRYAVTALAHKGQSERISAKESAVKVSEKMVEYQFAPFTITLVEIQFHGN